MDILIVLTGRREHGKDSVADFGIKNYNCSGKVALADWFKHMLAKEMRIPLEGFYDRSLKDAPLPRPIILTSHIVRRLMDTMIDLGREDAVTIPAGKWVGRQFHSYRDLLIWFGYDVVSKYFGEEFHCEITEKVAISKIKQSGSNRVIFVTDGRLYKQSKYFMDRHELVYPIKIIRPGSSNDTVAVESACDTEFPKSYFFGVLINDGSLEDLNLKVGKMLREISVNVAERMKLLDGAQYNKDEAMKLILGKGD